METRLINVDIYNSVSEFFERDLGISSEDMQDMLDEVYPSELIVFVDGEQHIELPNTNGLTDRQLTIKLIEEILTNKGYNI